MPTITFQPHGVTVDVPTGTELLDAARLAGIEIDAPCGGQGTCGGCAVRIVSGRLDTAGNDSLHITRSLDRDEILACRARVSDSDITIHVPEQSRIAGGQFIDMQEEPAHLPEDLLVRPLNGAALAESAEVQVSGAVPGDDLPDMARLTDALRLHSGIEDIDCGIYALRQIADAIRDDEGRMTVTLARKGTRGHIIDVRTRSEKRGHWGLAVDVGTTTVAVRLVSISDGKILTTLTDYNGQIACGLDIISRINYARGRKRLAELRWRVLNTINRLIAEALRSGGIEKDHLCSAFISGNTTMIHLLLGLNPEYIRIAPYTPTILEVPDMTASAVGLDMHPEAVVSFSPAVGSYVGGDITAGILCTDLVTETEDINIFIDLGTNGEVVVGNRDFLMACACSAGPAFEGGGIKDGMRAARGAIEKVDIDTETGKCRSEIIGGTGAEGICGSGMISLLAGLFRNGWIDAAGRFSRSKSSPYINFDGRQASYRIVAGEESKTGRDITIDERDIENVMRAKAAVYAACALMLRRAGITFEDLSHIYIAGGFGRYLNIEDAITIGLLPDLPGGRFRFLGNTSLAGSTMMLLSESHRRMQIEHSRRMTYVELNTDPEYMDQYTGALFLPHTDRRLFPSVGMSNPANQ